MGLPRAEFPTHVMVLPSTREKIKFRPYLVKEEKILLMATESQDESQMFEATKQVLKNCILEENFNIDEMTIFDMQYAFVQLRAKSVGEVADLKVICSHCQHPNDYKLDFNTINVVIPDDLSFDINLTNNIGVTMQFPKIGILNELSKQDMMDADNAIILIMACIKSVWDGETVYDPHQETLKEQTEFIESLSRKDMEKIEAFTNNIPNITKKVEFECSECGNSNTRELGGMGDFFS